jgi:uncharacterized membrane protein YadS
VSAPACWRRFVIAAAATFLADHYAGPVMLFALAAGHGDELPERGRSLQAGIAFAARTVLRLGVALLGFRITLGRLRRSAGSRWCWSLRSSR